MSSQTVFLTAGAVSQTIDVALVQKAAATSPGDPLTGLAFNTASLTAYYRITATGTPTAITLATQTVGGAYSSGGFVATDGTNCPGSYRFDVPNAAIATAGRSSVVFTGAASLATHTVYIVVTAVDFYDSVRMGMTALPNAAAAASGGLIINGSNAGTVTLAALTCTGTFTVSDGIVVTRSTTNGIGISATGNGTGHGIQGQSGSGVTGDGIKGAAASTNGSGINGQGTGANPGIFCGGGATGAGFQARGGATSGNGIQAETTTLGHGISSTGKGSSKHGIISTGGTAGTSDGISAVAGTGGVDIRGNITGNLTGNVSGSAGSVTGNVGGNVVGTVASVVGNVSGSVANVVGDVGGNVVGSVASVTAAVTVTGTVNADVKKVNGTTVSGSGTAGSPWGP